MDHDASGLLRSLGAGDSIAALCARTGLSRAEFDEVWATETRRRLPETDGTAALPVRRPVRLLRDRWGVVHLLAESEDDLFVGYGYAMAQDRLWQMDHQRRRGYGRQAEVLGPGVLDQDVLSLTMDLPGIAAAELAAYDPATVRLLEAFSRGVNAWIEAARGRFAIEFDLLGYEPDQWVPLDCAVSTGMWRWQLTGRPWVIAVPELMKRELAGGPLYRAFLAAGREADTESIVPPGAYPASRRGTLDVGASIGGHDGSGGSNNWVVAGFRSASGRPIVASDPHMPYAAQSSFWEVHLSGGELNAAGSGFIGMPGLVFGRNQRVAWAITNNICSLRDLYQEREDPDHPGCFLYDGTWEPWRERVLEVPVAGAPPHVLTVRHSRNGPIVDDLLPPAARGTGPVSMRWVGQSVCEWLPAQLRVARAASVDEIRAALPGWLAPTFSMVMADADGHVGYQATGAIPIREIPERGYRPGWDPAHGWTGLIPPEGMPSLADPARGYIATANNRPAPDDFPYPLSGTWDEGFRARRIRRLIEAGGRLAVDDMSRIHTDVHSGRSAERRDTLVAVLGGGSNGREAAAIELLRAWDCRSAADSAGAAIFHVFNTRWTQAVMAERISPERAEYVAAWGSGLAGVLLDGDPYGWFAGLGRREEVIRRTFGEALDELAGALGPDLGTWRWGRLHVLNLRHTLSSRGDLGSLLDHGGLEVGGDSATVCNHGFGGNRITPDAADYGRAWEATSGAGYRLVADLGSDPPVAWAVTLEGQSAHPASPHLRDQEGEFAAGRYHEVPLTEAGAERVAVHRLVLEPAG